MAQIIDVEDWQTQGFDDCSECYVSDCGPCDGPADLPNHLESIDLYNLVNQNSQYDVQGTGSKACGACRPERKIAFCCGYSSKHQETDLDSRFVILLSDDGISIEEICDNLAEDGGCTDYENRPLMCHDYHCQD